MHFSGKEEPMENLQLKIVHSAVGGRTGSRRLCESCAHGLVLLGEGMEFNWCGYMREYVPVRVEECNRYSGSEAERMEDSVLRLFAQYTRD
jgi:hypothetical protein